MARTPWSIRVLLPEQVSLVLLSRSVQRCVVVRPLPIFHVLLFRMLPAASNMKLDSNLLLSFRHHAVQKVTHLLWRVFFRKTPTHSSLEQMVGLLRSLDMGGAGYRHAPAAQKSLDACAGHGQDEQSGVRLAGGAC